MASLFICGDIVNQTNELNFVGEKLKKVIESADFAVCNFEGPEIGQDIQVSSPHQRTGTANYLKHIGFDLMLLANNHITDMGAEGVEYTIRTINNAGADFIGAGLSWDETYHSKECIIRGLNFGFINVCEAQVGQFLSKKQSFGYAWMGYESIFDDVKDLSQKTDYVIVFVHAGLEHYDIPLPEFREFYRNLCNSGADVVIGGHPHCAQGYEYMGQKLIIYSLGNFFFPLREQWPKETYSYSVILDFDDNKKVNLTPVFHHNNGIQVELEDNSPINLNYLNSLLGVEYENEVKDTIKRSYETLCKGLLIEALGGQNENDGLKRIVKKAINYTLFRKKYVTGNIKQRKALLLRLFENETYRYCIIRYLKEN